jgi:hypothetical protein
MAGFVALSGTIIAVMKTTETKPEVVRETETRVEVEVSVPHVCLVNSIEDVDFWFDSINANAVAKYDAVMEIFK